MLFVAAAGNDGKHNDTDASPTYPASFKLPNVISVAAYDNRDSLASFSNYGKETTHVGAPGVAIFSTTLNGYKFADGTSYAAPFVAGTAALLKSQVPSLSLGELKDRLLMTSEPISYYDKERTQSAGRISAVNALRDFRPARPRPPTAWSEEVFSDGTAHPYENKASKVFRVVHPRATHVRVHFKSFETEGCCDRVKIRDGNGTLITQYAGTLGDFWSADALGDTIVVEFTSDYSVTKHGFDIDRYEVSTEP